MVYEEKIHIPSSQKTVRHEVAPCVKCGSENIKIDEYDDEFGYISTATCPGCGQKVKYNVAAAAIIKIWNGKNDIDTLLASKADLIQETTAEIKQLKQLKKQRSKYVAKKPID